MVQEQRVLLCLLMVCLVPGLASAQLNCSLFTIDNLGSTTELSIEGLLATSLSPVGESTVTVPAKINNYRILCDASGRRRGTSSYVSLLVEFQCLLSGGSGPLAQCDGMTNITRQYQYSCTTSSNVWGKGVAFQTLNPTATFQTEPTNQCRQCRDPSEFTDVNVVDQDTHCLACENCNQGQARCYVESFMERCCNFYLEDECTAACPAPLMPNSTTFDCECPPLTLGNGSVTFTSGKAIGSIATYTCSDGYDLLGNDTRTCTRTGWSGTPVICNLTKCAFLPTIENGQVAIEPPDRTLDAQATYICDSGYSLRGDKTRTCQTRGIWSGEEPKCELCDPTKIDPNCIECAFDKSGKQVCSKCIGDVMPGDDGKCLVQRGNTSPSTCDTGCVVGIVLAILGAIIMAVVVALVVYAVYSYLTNPATKLAKTGTEGLNGVARDNPLYLPPDEIVGDVETA